MDSKLIKTEILKRLTVIELAATAAIEKVNRNDLNLTYEMGEISQYLQSAKQDLEALKVEENLQPEKLTLPVKPKSKAKRVIEYFAIENTHGIYLTVTRCPVTAWDSFFEKQSHRGSIQEARKAFEAIGYRCVQVSILEEVGLNVQIPINRESQKAKE